jgi:predicted O-methyltransferase YrrM
MDSAAHEVALACKGFLDDEEGLRLHDLARDYASVGPIVEIGSYCGKSSVYLGAGAREGGGTLVCVDHHRGSEEQQVGEEYYDPDLYDEKSGMIDTLRFLRDTIRRAGLEQTAVLVVSSSTTVAALCRSSLGMVFIDGGHSLETVTADYEAWADKIAPGGILAIHDLFPDPAEGGQAPIEIYRRALGSGSFDELPTTKTLGVLRKR